MLNLKLFTDLFDAIEKSFKPLTSIASIPKQTFALVGVFTNKFLSIRCRSHTGSVSLKSLWPN